MSPHLYGAIIRETGAICEPCYEPAPVRSHYLRAARLLIQAAVGLRRAAAQRPMRNQIRDDV